MHTEPCEWHRRHNGWKQLAAASFNIYISLIEGEIEMLDMFFHQSGSGVNKQSKSVLKKKKSHVHRAHV